MTIMQSHKQTNKDWFVSGLMAMVKMKDFVVGEMCEQGISRNQQNFT